jgi:hypothetical protein
LRSSRSRLGLGENGQYLPIIVFAFYRLDNPAGANEHDARRERFDREMALFRVTIPSRPAGLFP